DSILGIIAGSFVIAFITPDMLRRGIGVIIVLFILYKVVESRLKAINYTPHGWHGIVAGIIGGFTSALAHTGGPPVAIYLLMQNIPPRAFVATSALLFAVINLLKIPAYYQLGLLDFHNLWRVAWLLPLLPLGVWLGQQLSIKVDKVLFDWAIVGLLGISVPFLLFG
ncbi:MAG: sulfite exporter TauE/SafE family protein, partial [Okeania sp. SIO3B3]|nr:sulfite exporter TauE/SafE family protein [Okeania sp. SIO3B3]